MPDKVSSKVAKRGWMVRLRYGDRLVVRTRHIAGAFSFRVNTQQRAQLLHDVIYIVPGSWLTSIHLGSVAFSEQHRMP